MAGDEETSGGAAFQASYFASKFERRGRLCFDILAD
eukprot:SAG11_NODE_26127_length_349_cov_1.028000_1_plen_35_part_10